eukprot:scaffold9359_cov49-Cyclotella_meneghiniana.AAC.6
MRPVLIFEFPTHHMGRQFKPALPQYKTCSFHLFLQKQRIVFELLVCGQTRRQDDHMIPNRTRIHGVIHNGGASSIIHGNLNLTSKAINIFIANNSFNTLDPEACKGYNGQHIDIKLAATKRDVLCCYLISWARESLD